VKGTRLSRPTFLSEDQFGIRTVVKHIASTPPLDGEVRFLLWARYCQMHRDPAPRDLPLQFANALGLENLGRGLAPAATPA
jgi:hypothetical protein